MIHVFRQTLGQALVLAFALVTAVVGIGLKYSRYAAPLDAAGPGRIADEIAAVAARHGWGPTAIAGDGRETFPWLAFSKHGCPRPLVVALLKANGDLDSLARAIYGPDVAFLVPDQREPGWVSALGAAALRVAATAMAVAGQQSGATPRLALHPAPSTDQGEACAGPPRAAWLDRREPALLSEQSTGRVRN